MRTKVVTYPPEKVRTVQRIEELAKKYQVVAASRLTKVRATQIMALKKTFRGSLEIAVAKNTLAKMGLKQSGRPGAEEFLGALSGQSALIFTEFDPFKLYLLLERNRVSLPARAGDVASEDIVVPAGNTGQAPGPVLSEFKEAGVPTKIDAGSIWVTKDTVVAKTGGVISPKLAGLLARLGLKPIKAGVSVYLVNAYGRNLREEDVKIDLEEYRAGLVSARSEALALALETAYPAREIVPLMLARASANAMSLAVAAGYLSTETLGSLLAVGERQAKVLYGSAKAKGYS